MKRLPFMLIAVFLIASCKMKEQRSSETKSDAEIDTMSYRVRDVIDMDLRAAFDSVQEECGWEIEYFLFDITRDGKPDLFVRAGTCEANYLLFAYALEEGGVRRISTSPIDVGHSGLFTGKDYVLIWYAHQGTAIWTKVYYDGKALKAKEVFRERTESDYKQPEEREVELRPLEGRMPSE